MHEWKDVGGSTAGVGSTFFFTVTMKKSDEAAVDYPPQEPALLSSFTALIVDDNATNRRILEKQVKIWGMNAMSAASGEEALERMAQYPFSVALLDLQMPGMDGVALAREMRRRKDI